MDEFCVHGLKYKEPIDTDRLGERIMDDSWESANEKLVKDWSVEEVLAMLKSIGLNSLVDTFRLNGVQGKDLVLLSDEDFKELGMSGLQIKKVKNLEKVQLMEKEERVVKEEIEA